MANEPTIVVGRINDSELKSSIDKLVQHVAEGTQKMVTNFNQSIEQMKNKLKELGNTKVEVGSTASNETKETKEQTSALKQKKQTLDEITKAQKDALRIAYQRALKIPTDDVDLARAKLERLQALLRDNKKFQFMSPTQISNSTFEIQRLVNYIHSADAAQKQLNLSLASAQHYTSDQLREFRDLRAGIMEAARAARTAFAGGADKYAYFSHSTTTGNIISAEIYKENDARAKGLTIEQQIIAVKKQQREEERAYVAAQQQRSGLTQEQLAQLKQQLAAEQAITQEAQKRQKYVKPTTYPVDMTQVTKGIISQKLGVGAISADAQFDAIKRVDAALKQLQNTYVLLNARERNSSIGKFMIAQMQELEREAQKLRAEMSRPISLAAVIGRSEKTLDDMAYKMSKLSLYRSGLDVDKQRNEINQVNALYDRLKKKMDEVMQKNNQMINSNNALTRSWNYMKNRLAFYFTVGASTAFVKNLIQVRSEYEMNERALGILIDSAERGTQIFNELSQMALVSPYTLIELSAAAKQLTAYDVAAKDVVDTTRRLADMAAAVGIPIERLTYALGQIKAYGYLNSRDARMFSNAGIPLVKQLSEYYTQLEGHIVNTADVYDRMKKKTIDYADVMKVIYSMTDEGGKFFDFQAKMADTLKVRLANLTLAWNNMLNDIGKSQQGILTTGIGALRSLFAHWKDIYKAINNVLIPFGILKALQLAYWALTKNTIMAMSLQTVVGNKLAKTLKNIGLSLQKIITTKTTWFALLGMAIASAVSEIVRGNEAMREFNKTLSEGAADGYKNIKEYLEQAKSIRDSLYEYDVDDKGARIEETKRVKDINNDEAKKAWEEMRENIELTTTASDYFIGNLLQIDNVSQRLREGFGLLESIQSLDAAIKDMSNDTLALTKNWSGWWNLWTLPDGLLENLKDYQNQMHKLSKEKEDTARQTSFADGIDYETSKLQAQSIALEKLKKDFNETAESIEDFINHQGFADNPDMVVEAYDKIIKQIAPDPEATYALQKAAEERKSEAVREALAARIAYEQEQLANATDENTKNEIDARINSLKDQQKIYAKELDESRFYWNDFTKYIKERHISEMQKMFGSMTDEHDRNLYMQSEEWNAAVDSWVKGYATAHKMSYDEAFNYLKNWVKNANMWSIFIKLTISTEDGKSLFEQLSGYDSTIDSADKKIDRLNKRIDALNKKTNRTKQENEDLAKAIKEREEAQKEKDEAIEKGGVSSHDEKQAAKDARAAAAAARKQAAADRKAQKEAETELQKAFKDELQLIDKVRSQYKKLTDSGVKGGTALEMVTSQFENSIAHINQVLGKNGLPLFDIKAFAGTDNPVAMLEMLQAQLKAAKGGKNVKPSELKDLEIKVGELIVDAKVYNTKKIADGLNQELSKIKEDYELALELDANPELSDMFADILGIQNFLLPQTFEDAFDAANDIAKKKLKELGVEWEDFDLLSTAIIPDDDKKFRGLEMESEIVKALISQQKVFRDMFKKNITESEKLLDDYVKKYGDYSDKIAEIESSKWEKIKKLDEAYYKGEIRSRPEYTAKYNAIMQGSEREKGQAMFDEFKNSRLYVALFENLRHVSTATLTVMRQKLEELKNEMGTLSPEQLKQITQQFEKIDTELIRRNPFKNLVRDVKNYAKAIGKEGKEAQAKFAEAQTDYDEQLKVVTALKEQLEEKKAMFEGDKDGIEQLMLQIGIEEDKLKLLKEELDKAEALNDEYNLMRKIFADNANAITKIVQIIATNLQSLKTFRDYMQETFGVDMGTRINAVVDDLSEVGEGLNQITSSAQSGDVFGVVTGTVKAVSGIGDAIASIFGDGSARTKKLNKEIEKSAAAVWKLNYAYKELERAVNKSLGGAETNARRLAIANKEAELAELERQLALEKRKRGKDKDSDAIKELQEQIQDLRHNIADLKEELVTNLLGSDVKSAAEEFVDTWVQAWKAGEVTLDAINEKMSDMIFNLIKKAATSKIVSTLLKPLYDAVDEYTKEGSQGGVELTANEIKDLSDLSERLSVDINNALGAYYGNLKTIGALGNTGKSLSALQQGIQGITEDTAGALEAYMNSVSQQVYLQSDLLTQINNTLLSFNLDVQVATIGQILLQLQSSYQVQMAIQGVLEGWSTPNGMAVRVELNS